MSKKAWAEEDLTVVNLWKKIKFEPTKKIKQSELRTELKGDIFKEIGFGMKDVIVFSPAFWEKYLSGMSRIRTSYATYPDLIGAEPVRRPLGPVGYKLSTHVLRLTCNKKRLENKLSSLQNLKNKSLEELLVSAIITFQQALKKGVCVVLHCELGDFDCYWTLDEKHVYFYTYDTFEGGSGITKRIFNDWRGLQHIFENIRQTLSMNCCPDYCERCLLLPRTPEFYLRKGLLTKRTGRVFI